MLTLLHLALLLLTFQELAIIIIAQVIIDSKHQKVIICIAIKLVAAAIILTTITPKKRFRFQFYKANKILLIFKQCCKIDLFLKRLLQIMFLLSSRLPTGSHHLSLGAIEIRTKLLKIKIITRLTGVSHQSSRISNHSNSFKNRFCRIQPLMQIQMLDLQSGQRQATLHLFISFISIICTSIIISNHCSSTHLLVLAGMRRQFLIARC